MRRPRAAGGVDHGVGHDGQQAALELVAQRGHAERELGLLARRELHRPPERHDPGHVLRAGPDAELLAATVDDRLDHVPVAHDERSDSLRGADLVTGEGEQRARNIAERDGDLPEGLHGVHMERDAGLATSCREPRDRLYRADLVVDPHHAGDGDATPECFVQRILRHAARPVHRKDNFLTPEVDHGMGGREHRLVLDGRHGHAERSAAITSRERGADHRQVVRFGAARGEDHLSRLGTQGLGDGPLRLFHPRAGRPSEAVRRGRIAEGIAPQVGEHRLEHLRPYRRRGGIVEIDEALGHAGNLEATGTARQAGARPALRASRSRRRARRTPCG